MDSLSFTVALLASAILFFGGYYIGQWRSVSLIRRLIKVRINSYLLGQMIKDPEQRKGIAKAYYDSETALNEMDKYHWDATALILSPFVGYAPAPSKENNFQININQFRASENVLSPKPDEAYRLFIVGGSTAFGSGAPDQERTIGGYLKKYLEEGSPLDGERKYEIFTVAAPAWSSSHERIAVENLVSEMEPNLVVSFSGNNEAHWGWNFKNTMWFRSYADNHFWKIINAAYAAAGYHSFDDPIKDKSEVLTPETIARLLKKNVDLECHALAPTGSKHYFVFQPTIPLTKKALTDREHKILSIWHPAQIDYFRRYHKLATAELKTLEEKHPHFQFYDLTGLFDEMTWDEDVFLDSYHFGDKGYDIISKGIYDLIRPEVGKNRPI